MLSHVSVARLVTKGFAEVNDTRLYCEIVGKGHPLVLIHGFTCNTKVWDDQFEVFAKHFKVMRYDMRGFGKCARSGSFWFCGKAVAQTQRRYNKK